MTAARTDNPADRTGVVDVVVVGRGLIGSAAVRHLAESGRRVVAVGPDEPTDWASWTGPFSSHGDQGRITRIADADPIKADAARRSIERYAELERRSGISFHHPCGLVVVPLDFDRWLATSLAAGAEAAEVDPAELAATTGITVPAGARVGRDGPPAGMINPRDLVRAQNVVARLAGASIVAEAATTLTSHGTGRDGVVEVGGPWGSVRARRAVVATGSFGHHLLGRRLDVVRRPRTVLLAELDEPAGPGTLPSLIVAPGPDDRLESIYWVPPVPYPDGRTLLKIGGSLTSNPVVGADAAGLDPHDPATDRELVEWFHGSGDPTEIEALHQSLAAMLPGAPPRWTSTVPCVYTGTPSGYPAIDWFDERVAVAIGGNGWSAKSSDELGRLAAALVTDGDLGQGPDQTVFAASWATADVSRPTGG